MAGYSLADDCAKVDPNAVIAVTGRMEWHPSPHVYEITLDKPICPVCGNPYEITTLQLGGKTTPKKYDNRHVTVSGRLDLCNKDLYNRINELSVK